VLTGRQTYSILEQGTTRSVSELPSNPEGTTVSEFAHVPTAGTPHTDSPDSIGSSGGSPPGRARPLSPGQQSGWQSVRRIATAAWLTATGVQVAVWFVICVATGSIDTPWWLWTLFGGGLVIGVLRLLDTTGPKSSVAGGQQR
jgi:hypothetical protein